MKNDRYRIPKSRYSSVDCYISPESAPYNDIEIVQDMDVFRKLTDNGRSIVSLTHVHVLFAPLGIDPLLAQHIAHLFIRDPVILFEEKLEIDDTKMADHFEVSQFRWV